MLDSVQEISMDKLVEPEDVHRQSIDMEKIRELAESIREQGLLQPILVRPRNGNFEIIAGHRRYLASKLIDLKVIKAVVKDLDDTETTIIRATENLQREDLTVMEEARVYGTLRDKLKMTIEGIARKMGKHSSTVRRYLNLLDLPDEFQRALNAGLLSVGVVEVLQNIDNSDLQKYYLDNAIQSGCSVKTAALWLQDYEATKAAQYYGSVVGPDGTTVIPQAKPIYYTCDACFGSIEISQIKHLCVCVECAQKVRAMALA